MKKSIIIVLILIILTSALIVLLNLNSLINITNSITGNTIFSNNYSYTKAICNETNYCEDYQITCENNQIIQKTFTGRAIQYSDSWQDPRDNETINKSC